MVMLSAFCQPFTKCLYFGEQEAKPPKAASICHQKLYFSFSFVIASKSSKSAELTVPALEIKIKGCPFNFFMFSSKSLISIASRLPSIVFILVKFWLPIPNIDKHFTDEECGVAVRIFIGAVIPFLAK